MRYSDAVPRSRERRRRGAAPERSGRRLAGADLSGEDLRDSHLSGADLTGARLVGTNLQGVDLRGARLHEATLDAADLRDAWLDGADLRFASLAGVRADGAAFRRADLTLAHLRGSDFRSTDFTEALLTDADLSHSSFERAILADVDLIGAELAGASFHEAVLAGANLRDAHLESTDFTRARFAFTVLAASDLSRARGLDTVVHDGPSTVGIDAFLLSRGEIPDAFLEGIGLSSLAIDYLKSVAAAEEGMLVGDAIFLLFHDADRSKARRLRAYLRMHHHQAWYWQQLEELTGRHNPDLALRVRFHDRLLVLASGPLYREAPAAGIVHRALSLEAKEKRPIVFGLRLDDAEPPPPFPGRDRLLADFRHVDWDDPRDATFRRELERLRERLDGG